MNKNSVPAKPKCILGNGLMVLSVKRQEGKIAVIKATDFVKESAKFFFDREQKQLLPNPYSISLSEVDGKKLDEWIGT